MLVGATESVCLLNVTVQALARSSYGTFHRVMIRSNLASAVTAVIITT